ncbi:MAG: cell division protein ZapD [Proteobacteria bacterium]|nr:cell division protein ZapD [Pseudomonadota bacterium]
MSTEIGAQSTLFPEADIVTVFEQPLSERIRNCLRLEHLFSAIRDGLDGETEWHARAGIVSTLEVCDLLTRTDIKGELIKELERHVAKITTLRNNPDVDQATLEGILADVVPLVSNLKSTACHPGATMRADELITQVKQRIAIPGGTCNFDLPAFHHWLCKPLAVRSAHLKNWLSDLVIIERAVSKVLKMLRESSSGRSLSVEDGLYQQQLDPALQYQLIRLTIDNTLDIFPEISGGKHRFVVRFFRQPDTKGRPVQAREVVKFNLQCCAI